MQALAAPSRFQRLFEHAPDAILLTQSDGAILDANRSAAELFGCTREELRTWRREDLVELPPSPAISLAVAQRTRTGRTKIDLRYRRRDGSTFIGETTSVVLETQSDLTTTATIIRDVTDTRRRTQQLLDREQELRETVADLHASQQRTTETAEQLRRVLDGADVASWEWDLTSNHMVFSERAVALTGYTLAELGHGHDAIRTLVHPDDLPKLMNDAARCLSGEAPQLHSEHRVRHRDGRWIWILMRGRVVRHGADGTPQKFSGTCENITGEHDALESLRASLARNEALVAELQAAVVHAKTLGDFLPICMHCKKIRDDDGFWERIEKYVHEHTGTQFSHGICPDCLSKFYPQFGD